MIEIVYPGSGNKSQFSYDCFGRNVEIVENTSSSVTSTKQFIWYRNNRAESRDSSGSIISQFFNSGQTISGSNYLYTKDHLGSIREMTDSSGNIEAQLVYDPYGRMSQIQGSLSSDFQYAGYYSHGRSGLNLAVHRAYQPSSARWLNRDPIDENGGINLYSFVNDNPIIFVDVLGLYCTCRDVKCCDQNYDECKARGGPEDCCSRAHTGCLNNVPPIKPNGVSPGAGFSPCTRKPKPKPAPTPVPPSIYFPMPIPVPVPPGTPEIPVPLPPIPIPDGNGNAIVPILVPIPI